MRGLIAGLLELARSGAQAEKEEFQFDELVEDTVDRARGRFPAVELEGRPARADGRRRLSRPDGARALEPARERRQVERRRRRRSRSRSPAASCRCATTGRASRTRTGLSSSIASIALPRLARCPAPGSGWRSSARWRRRTAARWPPRTPGTAAPSSASASTERPARQHRSTRDELLGASNPRVVRFESHRTPPGPAALTGRGQPGPASSRIPCGEGVGLSGR